MTFFLTCETSASCSWGMDRQCCLHSVKKCKDYRAFLNKSTDTIFTVLWSITKITLHRRSNLNHKNKFGKKYDSSRLHFWTECITRQMKMNQHDCGLWLHILNNNHILCKKHLVLLFLVSTNEEETCLPWVVIITCSLIS